MKSGTVNEYGDCDKNDLNKIQDGLSKKSTQTRNRSKRLGSLLKYKSLSSYDCIN